MKIKALVCTSSLLAATAGLWGCDNELPGTLLPLPTKSDSPGKQVGSPDGDDDPTNDGNNPNTGDYSAGEDNTFDHMDDLGATSGKDPFEALKEQQEEGPPEVRTRLHSCQKPQIAAIGNVLAAFGVDLAATGDPAPAGQLYNEGRDALGAANYAQRTGEALYWTNSGATKFQDIFVMAAPEIIANLPTAAQCQVDGVGPTAFNEDNTCNEDAVSCLIGRPATEEHLAICDYIVSSAGTDPTALDQAKQLAVAALLSAAYSCE